MPCHHLRHVTVFALLMLGASTAQAASLNDAGQIACYDNTATPTGTVGPGIAAPESVGFAEQDCSLGASAPTPSASASASASASECRS